MSCWYCQSNFVIDQDALYPLLSLMDHEDIGVVSSFGLVIFKIRI